MTAARRSSRGAVTAVPMQFRVSGSPSPRSFACISAGGTGISKGAFLAGDLMSPVYVWELPPHRMYEQSVSNDGHCGVGDAGVGQKGELRPQANEASGKLLTHLCWRRNIRSV